MRNWIFSYLGLKSDVINILIHVFNELTYAFLSDNTARTGIVRSEGMLCFALVVTAKWSSQVVILIYAPTNGILDTRCSSCIPATI